MPSLNEKICSVEECNSKYFSNSYCNIHCQRQWKIDHPIYGVWSGMKSRCNNPNNDKYSYYGGRGIKVCDRWRIYQNFVDDMLPTFKQGLTLDRIDNEGNYEPSNCRWASKTEQNLNQRIRSNNTTGVTGIYWNKQCQKWSVEYMRKYYGLFATREEAIKARQKLETS